MAGAGAGVILRAVEMGEGPPVALLHGLFGQARNLAGLQRGLAAGRRVIALDLRNHGDSPHAPVGGYGDLAADVAETLDAMGVLPCAVVGHSMGGKTAMRLALDAPDAVTRLLVADIAPIPYPSHFGAYAHAMRAIPLAAGLTRGAADAALAPVVADPAIRAFLLANLRTGPAPGWRCGLDEIIAGLAPIEGWDATGTWDGPALLVRGARSDYVPDSARPAIRALFPSARIATVKAAGHWLHVDNPAGFLAVVSTFVPAA
jgi:pimeloyl-ACP methyl ester carboxylesterase